uniref:Alcohol dehydrogenase [NADP(+)] A n=1 Tax=Schistocephalus solidus TaxID=70667 RepID=A0A0X3PNE9_SCHSO
MITCPCIKLQDGNKVPLVGLGTAQLWNTNHGVENVRRACERSLRRLGLSYIDLYLVHWPMGFTPSEEEFKGGDCAADETWSYNQGEFLRDFHRAQPVDPTPLEDTWKEMEKLVDAGLVKSLGLANFNRSQIERILKICRIRPQMLQVELSVHFMNWDIVEFAKSVGMQVTGYATLGSPALAGGVPSPMYEPHVKEIALRHHKTPSQVLIRHMLQLGICTIPKSVNPKRIIENFNVFDFELTPEEVQTLSTCGRNERLFKALAWKSHPEYPFTEEAPK